MPRPTPTTIQPPQHLTCLRCLHTWTPRQAVIGLCPRCKSRYWNTPRTRKPRTPKNKPQGETE